MSNLAPTSSAPCGKRLKALQVQRLRAGRVEASEISGAVYHDNASPAAQGTGTLTSADNGRVIFASGAATFTFDASCLRAGYRVIIVAVTAANITLGGGVFTSVAHDNAGVPIIDQNNATPAYTVTGAGSYLDVQCIDPAANADDGNASWFTAAQGVSAVA